MKVIHLNYSDINGGAARAAYRIHHALCDTGVESKMWVNVAAAGDYTVETPLSALERKFFGFRQSIVNPFSSLLKTEETTHRSISVLPSKWPKRINESDADIVHMHWINAEMLSIADIGRIKKPLVWTLHDMWAFCGAEHYTNNTRWRDGYNSDNRPCYESGFDLNRWTWERKVKHWKRPIHIVGDSSWITECVAQSKLMRHWHSEFIYYPLDLQAWSPIDKVFARKLLGLPIDKPLLAFGAMDGARDPRKGFDLLTDALKTLSGKIPGLELVVFGQLPPREPLDLGFPIHYTGHLHDDLSLRAVYSASDLLVVPSRMEAFGQTASEAHACATPVVSFNVGGLPDTIEHLRTGYLANPFDVNDLASGIQWVLENSAKLCMSKLARTRAEKNFNPVDVAKQYLNLYEKVLSK